MGFWTVFHLKNRIFLDSCSGEARPNHLNPSKLYINLSKLIGLATMPFFSLIVNKVFLQANSKSLKTKSTFGKSERCEKHHTGHLLFFVLVCDRKTSIWTPTRPWQYQCQCQRSRFGSCFQGLSKLDIYQLCCVFFLEGGGGGCGCDSRINPRE